MTTRALLFAVVLVGCSTESPPDPVDAGPVVCTPGEERCVDNSLERCAADGTGFDTAANCNAVVGETCRPSIGCVDACAEAAAERSYVGCEFWPTVTLNATLEGPFRFVVAVGNPNDIPTYVTVDRGSERLVERVVAAGEVALVSLPWVPELRGGPDIRGSFLVRQGAYRLRSTFPITAYQFNPLRFLDEGDTPSPDDDRYSFTNDASLLLPSSVLGDEEGRSEYVVMSRAALWVTGVTGTGRAPGFVTMVGADERPVQVTVTAGSRIIASPDGEVAAMAPDDAATFTLAPGDVLQLVSDVPEDCPDADRVPRETAGGTRWFCRPDDTYDLTGTRLVADGRLSVIGGHQCAFVPFDTFACDHLEESLFPLATWGREAVLSPAAPPLDVDTSPDARQQNMYRVLSGEDGNQITFNGGIHDPVTLDRGEYVELRTNRAFIATGTGRLNVGQFLLGQAFSAGTDAQGGDPSMSLGIPVEQYRTEYTVLAPETYDSSFANLVLRDDEGTVWLDGREVRGWEAESERLQVTNVYLTPGVHELTGDRPFGVVVYGYGRYTSYMYPGGLDLVPLVF